MNTTMKITVTVTRRIKLKVQQAWRNAERVINFPKSRKRRRRLVYWMKVGGYWMRKAKVS